MVGDSAIISKSLQVIDARRMQKCMSVWVDGECAPRTIQNTQRKNPHVCQLDHKLNVEESVVSEGA